MTVQIKTLDAWSQTRNTLVEDLTMTLGILQGAPYSDDPASPYLQAQARETDILGALRRHAVLGLEEIDDAIAAGPLVAEIGDLSNAAKHEADRIAAIAHTIDDIACAVTMVTAVVDKFATLAVA